MKKKDYREEIHALFEEMRSKIEVKSRITIYRLQILEDREKYALEINTKNTVRKLKAEIREKRQKIFKLPFAGKKYTVLGSGKIKEEILIKP